MCALRARLTAVLTHSEHQQRVVLSRRLAEQTSQHSKQIAELQAEHTREQANATSHVEAVRAIAQSGRARWLSQFNTDQAQIGKLEGDLVHISKFKNCPLQERATMLDLQQQLQGQLHWEVCYLLGHAVERNAIRTLDLVTHTALCL